MLAYPLFNTTIRFNQTELCPIVSVSGDNPNDIIASSTEGDSEPKPSPTMESSPSPTTIPLSLLGQTTCEVLQAISRDVCHVDPSSCRSMECSLHQIRINMTILPCGGTPGVNIDAYHMLEQVTLLHKDFTTSQREAVTFRGETILFHLNVIVKQSPLVPDQITFMVS